MSVALGSCVKDSITGFEGTVVSVCENLHGDTRIAVVLHNLDQGKVVQEWFNVGRVSIVDKSVAKCIN